jgi:hypothetical protein
VDVHPLTTRLKKIINNPLIYEVILRLIRHSYILVSQDVMVTTITDNLITLGQTISLYCSRSITTTVGKGKKALITVKRVVSKLPTRSPVLTTAEMKIILHFLQPYFTLPTGFTEEREWVRTLATQGFASVESLKAHYRMRDDILQRFSIMSTGRLNKIRTYLGNPLKKKKEVTLSELSTFSSSSTDPLGEVSYLVWALNSPRNKLITRILGDPEDTQYVGIPAALNAKVKSTIFALIGESKAPDAWSQGLESTAASSSTITDSSLQALSVLNRSTKPPSQRAASRITPIADKGKPPINYKVKKGDD